MDGTGHTRDHGGNLDAAMARHGGARADWMDLSTGINPMPYPVPPILPDTWASLPTRSDMTALREAAANCYNTQAAITAFAGAQGAIQAIPFLHPPGQARVLGPTYNEHAAALRMAGWQVNAVGTPDALAGADLAVVVNPNNPDGRRHGPEALRSLAERVGLLVVDESFVDPEPALSLAPTLPHNAIVLRSFGKFYGLAGVRLGFALSAPGTDARLSEMAGPWPVSGPAIRIACKALADLAWHTATCARLAANAARLDAIAQGAGWQRVGGTPLFRTYATPDPARAQDRLARARIWSRIFPYSDHWIRLGLPQDSEDNWDRLDAALRGAP